MGNRHSAKEMKVLKDSVILKERTYDVEINNSRSSASSQTTSDAKAMPASLTTLGFLGESEHVARSLKKLTRFFLSSKRSNGRTACKRTYRLKANENIEYNGTVRHT